MPLGDLFSVEERRDSIRRQLTPGRVFKLFCAFTNPQKDKYLLLACTQPRPLLFIINSEISEYIKKREHLHKCQVPISAGGHDFLKHDSYIDCSEARTDFHLIDIERQVLEDMSRIKGLVAQNVKDELLKAVDATNTISRQHKKWIVEGLRTPTSPE